MNLIMRKSGMKLFDKIAQGTRVLKYLAQYGIKNSAVLRDMELLIKELSQQNYLGYSPRATQLNCDLLFSCRFLKQMKDFITPAFSRLLLGIAANEFTSGQKYREEGAMKSLLIPDTNRQKVVHFCPLRLREMDLSPAYVLIEVGEARDWNSHKRSLSGSNDFRRKAANRQQYYEPIYRQSQSIGE